MKAVLNKELSLTAMAAIVMAAIRADETAVKRIAALLDTRALSFICDQNIQIPESVSIVNSDVFETSTGISMDAINDFEIVIDRNKETNRLEVFFRVTGYHSKEEKASAKCYNEGANKYELPLALLPDYGMDWE